MNPSIGSEADWLATLVGATGDAGADGSNGTDGAGWTGATYDAATGQVTFTSDDDLGLVTGDLRGAAGSAGADGLGWTGATYNPENGKVTFTSNDGLELVTGDLRGLDASPLTYEIVDPANYGEGASFVASSGMGHIGVLAGSGQMMVLIPDANSVSPGHKIKVSDVTGGASQGAPIMIGVSDGVGGIIDNMILSLIHI